MGGICKLARWVKNHRNQKRRPRKVHAKYNHGYSYVFVCECDWDTALLPFALLSAQMFILIGKRRRGESKS
jgi:hypothetical protein